MELSETYKIVDALGNGWGAEQTPDETRFTRGQTTVVRSNEYIEANTLEDIVADVLDEANG